MSATLLNMYHRGQIESNKTRGQRPQASAKARLQNYAWAPAATSTFGGAIQRCKVCFQAQIFPSGAHELVVLCPEVVSHCLIPEVARGRGVLVNRGMTALKQW